MYSPFNLKISPMRRLLLIGFEKDHDETYIGLEPQWFDDPTYGTGLRVIAWRRDGYVDVYQQPALPTDTNFGVAAKGLADLLVRPMPNARLRISTHGVDVSFAFEDKIGREIKVEITEKSLKPTRPFNILAPVGSSSTNPASLPVFFLHDFYFVRRSHTKVKICIDGRFHRPDTFPLPLDWSRIYFMRYSGDTLLIDWCNAYTGRLSPLRCEGAYCEDSDGVSYELVERDGHKAIRCMSARYGHHRVSVEFAPPVPDITCLAEQTNVDGRFTITGHESVGEISGIYRVARSGNDIEVRVNPSDGWKARPKTAFLKMMFTVAKIFRNWPKTYQWTAKIRLGGSEPQYMDSSWTRV